MTPRLYFFTSTLGRAVKVLPKKDLSKFSLIIILQILMGGLDLIGIALIGILGAIAVTGVESHQKGGKVNTVLRLFHIENQTFQPQVAILGVLAVFIFVSKTIISITFSKRILYFLSRRGAIISGRLISKLLGQPLLKVQERTNKEIIYSVTTGVTLVTLGIIGSAVSLISDGSLLVLIAGGLFVVDPIMAVSTFVLFGAIALYLYFRMHKKVSYLGERQARYSIKSNEKILEVLNSYRESIVRNRRAYYAEKIRQLRLDLALTEAELSYIPNLSKYASEMTLVLGALAISAIQFARKDAAHAVASLTVFLAAGTRIAPAVLRAQQGILQIKGGLATAGPTLDLIEDLDVDWNEEEASETPISFIYDGFKPEVVATDLTLRYPGSDQEAVSKNNFTLQEGQSVAIVGASGAGKTSLVDLILGVIDPISGSVKISGCTPTEAIAKWSGAIGYVPQNVMVAQGSIRDNVALGYPSGLAVDEEIWRCLRLAQLDEVVRSNYGGLYAQVFEGGNKLSGGQRQRLGIARALFTNPRLLVLDEATSALDGQTEYDLSEAIQNLKGKVTTILVAHRLSTVRNVDLVIFLDKGRLVSQGTFDEVRAAVPDFDKQAKLMGL